MLTCSGSLPHIYKLLNDYCCNCFVANKVLSLSLCVCGNWSAAEAVMLSQPVWDQMLESEKKKVQTLEESYAEKMRGHNVSRS